MPIPLNPLTKQGTAARVAVLGEALIDHFPDADVIGGAPFNVARNLAALGATAMMVTRVGDDADAAALLHEFERFSLSQSGIQRDQARATGNVRVTLKSGQPTFHIADDQAWDAIDPAAAQASVTAFAPHIVCFGTLAQRHTTSRAAIRDVVTSSSCLKVLDLNLRTCAGNEELSAWSLGHADIVKVNDDELLQLLAWFVPYVGNELTWAGEAHRRAVRDLVIHFGIKRLIVTRGAHGSAAFDDAGELAAEGLAPGVDVVDTVGAGDAFLAVCLLATLNHWPLANALAEAGAFAAAICTLRGAVTANQAFYQPWRERFDAMSASARACATKP
jgi:fructokinase